MISAQFIPSCDSQILLTGYGPASTKQLVLCVPGLFEELNLSRAVVAKLGQYLSTRGTSFFQLDYAGTGDSQGELEDSTSQIWLQNVLDAGAWLSQQGAGQIILLGVRFGALLQLHFQPQLHEALNIQGQIVWKPITSGKTLSNQLLRLKHTNHVLNGGEKVDWREKIRQGEVVEVAGYPINESLLSSIEALSINPESPLLSSLDWLELGAKVLPPAVGKFQKGWPDARFNAVDVQTFWQIPDIYTEPALHAVHEKIIGRL
ncbi:hypothetical protein GCM10010982_01540 [Bowmanella pacifica]|uniref:Serine aminopeptidase S33 domain-containing protein n=1 Tax=Bowmanella pacifica TaxID=502051 RepID=A0A917YQR6_9ALTE|nr:hypothetical protein GCM10010982_01540 [Bowmanella pacifica]